MTSSTATLLMSLAIFLACLFWLYFEINKGWSLILDQTIKCTLVRGSPFTKFGCRSDWPGMTSVWPLNQAMHYIALTEPSSTHFNTEPLSMLSWNEVSLLRSSSSPLRGSWYCPWDFAVRGNWVSSMHYTVVNCLLTSGVARIFPGGRHAHPDGQNEEENK